MISCRTTKSTKIKCTSEFGFRSDYLIEGNDRFLKQFIREQTEKGVIGNSPMLVIDAIPYIKCNSGKINVLPISKSEVAEIAVLDGEQSSILYGKQAREGLILITTKSYKKANN